MNKDQLDDLLKTYHAPQPGRLQKKRWAKNLQKQLKKEQRQIYWAQLAVATFTGLIVGALFMGQLGTPPEKVFAEKTNFSATVEHIYTKLN